MGGLRAWVCAQCVCYDASHDAEHAANVHRLAECILAHDLPGASRHVQQAVCCAAWSHDVCDRKYVADAEAAADRVARACVSLGAREDELALALWLAFRGASHGPALHGGFIAQAHEVRDECPRIQFAPGGEKLAIGDALDSVRLRHIGA